MAYKQIVSQEKAEARAVICLDCPHNQPFNKTSAEKLSDMIVEASIGKRRVSVHNKLYNCEVCSCPLRAKVWFGGKIELSKEEREKLPSFCWQLNG